MNASASLKKVTFDGISFGTSMENISNRKHTNNKVLNTVVIAFLLYFDLTLGHPSAGKTNKINLLSILRGHKGKHAFCELWR